MGHYRLLVFDLDGTLVDTAPDITECVNAVLKEEGLPSRGIQEVKKAIGLGVHELIRGLSPRPLDPGHLERLVLRFRELYWADSSRLSRPFPGVIEALAGPLAAVRKAVLTNKPHDYAVKILAELGMASHFEIVVGGGHRSLPYKPQTGGLEYILSQADAKPADTALIGDSSIDRRTAQDAGVDFFWVGYGYEEPPQEETLPVFSKAAEWSALANGRKG